LAKLTTGSVGNYAAMALATRDGLNQKTVRKCRKSTTTAEAPMRPGTRNTSRGRHGGGISQKDAAGGRLQRVMSN
jgi:hypothetical protein